MAKHLYVRVARLRVRSGPGLSHNIVGHVVQGQTVATTTELLVKGDGYHWVEVDAQRHDTGQPITGWVAREFMRASPAFRAEVWPAESNRVTQYYGENKDYYQQWGLDGHEGIDIAAPFGSAILAIAGGIVKMVYLNPKPASQGGHNYGIHVRLSHPGGYESIYAHMLVTFVQQGDLIYPGHVLGQADSTGNSSGNHLHLSIKEDGHFIDPWPFLEVVQPW